MNPNFPTEKLTDISQQPQNYRLLERIPLTQEGGTFPMQLNSTVGDEQVLVLLDTETTGLLHETDAIIELGMVKVLYSPLKKPSPQLLM